MTVNGTPPSPLRLARQQKGARLEDIAKKAGIAVSYLSMIERGLVVGPDVRDRLATALDKPEADIFPGAA